MLISLIINIVAIINVFIIFVLLFFRRENALPNKVLAVAFLIPGLYFVNNIFILQGVEKYIPFSLFFVQAIAVGFPIMIYCYFNLLVGRRLPKSRFLYIGSGILFVYISVLAIRFFKMPDLDQSAYIQKLFTEDYPTDLMIYTVLFYTWQLVYFSVITKEVMRYKRQLDDSISNLDQSQFYYMVRFITMLWIFNAALVVLYILLPLYLVDYTFLPILVNLIYFFILFFSYHHNAVFTSISFEKLNEVNEEVSKDEPENSRNKKCFEPTEKHLSVFEKLEELIEKDMIFIDPNLSIRSISSKIEAPEYVVSQTINHYFQKSFFDLINERRINEAKTRLQNMLSNETIEGIGYDVGFNSRSSFYRAFRKHVGKTPKQFVESSK